MAKKSSNSSNTMTYNKLAGILAVISIFISGTIYTINLIVKLVGGSFSGGILNLIANVFMIVAIVMISWRALKSAKLPCKKAWIIAYWVFVILALVGQIAFVM